ncbi:MAG: N-acetylmuramoyl-L-alanine amidase [Candidatus Paceibacterota bacterium]|jgi:hypothetical protein
MLKYANKHDIPVPLVSTINPIWGKGKRILAWRISEHAFGKKNADAKKTKKLCNLLFPELKGYPIRRDYHAVHKSGVRSLSKIRLIVLHDMENTDRDDAAENTGSWFENRASGGSTHYGVDNDSIQSYLADNVICWGAPHANLDGIHIEQMGKASWSTAEWLKNADGTLKRTAWLMRKLSKRLNVPLVLLSDSEVRAGKKGVVTHAQISRIYGGTHTDPGRGYPLSYVMKLARSH